MAVFCLARASMTAIVTTASVSTTVIMIMIMITGLFIRSRSRAQDRVNLALGIRARPEGCMKEAPAGENGNPDNE